MKRLVLASCSPRRREILKQLGLKFEVKPSGIDEIFPEECPPEKAAAAIALQKVRDVVKKLNYPAYVIGADTLVLLDGEIMGKPADTEQAFQMLERLSGREHTVITGVAVADSETGEERSGYQKTLISMKDICPERIRKYVNTGEPLGKAGAYAVQGRAAIFIQSIRGCYFNVVGLPIAKLDDLFSSLDVDLFALYKFDKG